MATKFTKGQVLQVATVVPKGPVLALRMDEDGEFYYQISWKDTDGASQIRWFSEKELEAV